MSKSLIITCNNGCNIISNEASILIDPVSKTTGLPDWIIFSGPRSAVEGLNYPIDERTSVFAASSTKKLMLLNYMKHYKRKTYPAVDEIIDCRLRTKNTLRKKGNVVAEFVLHGYGDLPGTCAIHLRLRDKSIVYVTGKLQQAKTLPRNDILIINAQRKIPLEAIMSKIPKFTVEVSDLSKLYDVLDFFNSINAKNLVGIDDSVLAPACEFFKYDCAVFSSAVKPLTSLSKSPPVIITSNPAGYKDRPSLSSSLFLPGATLSDIYALAAKTESKKIIAICPNFTGMRKRGDITFCGNGSVFET